MEAVMSGRSRRAGQDFGEVPAESEEPWAIVGLVIAIALGVLVAASSGPSRCPGIAKDNARLACFDAAASVQPAKGAAIPYNRWSTP
jgi:heme A synthase